MGTSIVVRQRVNEMLNSTLAEILTLPDEQAATKLDARVRAYDTIELLNEGSYLDIGRIAHEMQQKDKWQYVTDPSTGEPCASFNAWSKSCPSSCRAKIWAAKTLFEDLSADLRPEQLDGVPRGKLKVLRQLSSSVRVKDEVLEAARNKKTSVADFRKLISDNEPDQHIDQLVDKKFHFEVSAWTNIQASIEHKKAEFKDNTGISDEEALEYICADYEELINAPKHDEPAPPVVDATPEFDEFFPGEDE
jgi:hypothetical protein